MGKCYSCKYFRPSERKCGYKGYSSYPDMECDAAEYDSSYGDVCGNCKYYSVEGKRCQHNGNYRQPYDRCDTYRHSRA